MQIIHNWLAGKQNFVVGSTLYKSFGKDDKLKDLLAKGETPTAKRMLVDALKKLVEPGKVVSLPEKVIDKVVVKETVEMPVSDDVILESLRQQWLAPYQHMNLLRHELDKFGNDNGWEAIAWRQPRAREIKELELKCKAIWAKRDYYEKEGKLPFVSETKLIIPTDPVELAELISNIKKYIRRYRKAMKDKPGNAKHAQLYVEYKAQHKLITGKDYEEKD